MPSSTVPITGDTGRVKIAGTSLVQFNKWSVNPKAETKQTRAYDDVQGWERSTEATLKMWDGSFEGNFVQSQYEALFAQLGKKVTAVFVTEEVSGTEYGFEGEIIVTELPITHAVGEIVTVSVSFRGTGPLEVLVDAVA